MPHLLKTFGLVSFPQSCLNNLLKLSGCRSSARQIEARRLNRGAAAIVVATTPLTHLIQLHLKPLQQDSWTRLPVSLPYGLNNKNRLALKRCSETAERSLHICEGEKFRLQEDLLSFRVIPFGNPELLLGRFRDDSLSLNCSFS